MEKDPFKNKNIKNFKMYKRHGLLYIAGIKSSTYKGSLQGEYFDKFYNMTFISTRGFPKKFSGLIRTYINKIKFEDLSSKEKLVFLKGFVEWDKNILSKQKFKPETCDFYNTFLQWCDENNYLYYKEKGYVMFTKYTISKIIYFLNTGIKVESTEVYKLLKNV